MSARSVVITGMGMVSPLAVGVFDSWMALIARKCGIVQSDPVVAGRVPFWALVQQNLLLHWDHSLLSPSKFTSFPRSIQMALIAAVEAAKQAKIHNSLSNAAVCIGQGLAPFELIGPTWSLLGKRRISPRFISHSLHSTIASTVSIVFNSHGQVSSPSTGCATGLSAIGEAYRLIRHGYVDVALAGASESPLDSLTIEGFAQTRALNTNATTSPLESCRPFSVDRCGFVLGEGAGILVLESLESATKRGVSPLATIVGFGSASDAHHETSPHPKGLGASLAMEMALRDASNSHCNLAFVSAHATGTVLGDDIEASVINRIAPSVAVTANKAAIGHLLGASGALQAIFAVQSLRDRVIPPTLNSHNHIPIDVSDYPRSIKQTKPLAICNAFAFGGICNSLSISI